MADRTATIRLMLDHAGLTTGAAHAGKDLEGFGLSGEKVAQKIGGAFSRLGNTIGGEVGEILNRVGEGFDKLEEKGTGAKMQAIGGVVTGIGVALQGMASADKQAQDQLAQAVANTGKSVADYKEEFEKAIKTQENFGHSAVDTQQALQKMTQATGDPSKALEHMGLVADLAAAKHISLADAAGLAAKIIAGSGKKTMAEFGLVAEKAGNAVKDLERATRLHTNAQTALQAAQEHYTLLQDQMHAKHSLSIVDQDKLKIAHEKVTTAQLKLAEATKAMAFAHDEATHAGKAQADNLQMLSDKIHGQAEASVDNFGAKLGILKTKVMDNVAAFGEKFGPAITAAGPILMVTGSIMEILAARHTAAAAAAAVQGAAEVAATTATEGATVASDALNVSLLANPMTWVVVGIVAFVAALVVAYNKVSWFHDGVNAMFGMVKTAIGWIITAVENLAKNFATGFGVIKTVVADVWAAVQPILAAISGAISAVIGGITNAIGKVADFAKTIGGGLGGAISGIGKLLGFDTGGIVPGPVGRPTLAIVHGGEQVLTADQASGRQALPANVGGNSSGGGTNVNVYASTNATAADIARETLFAIHYGSPLVGVA